MNSMRQFINPYIGIKLSHARIFSVATYSHAKVFHFLTFCSTERLIPKFLFAFLCSVLAYAKQTSGSINM